jgi:glycosyltransferase involved in cell wall biosynthesis
VLVHGIDATRVAVSAGGRETALRRLGLPEGPFTVGTVANLTPKKDQGTLIAAMVLLRERVPDPRLVIIGDGPSRPLLEDQVRSLGLHGSVLFAGVRDDVPELLPALDVFSLSSLHEGLPIALLEAMAAGVPPVVTAVGGIPEVVTHERDGLLVPPGDSAALASALCSVATDGQLRASLARSALSRAQQFGIAPAAAELTSRYVELAGTREEARFA